MNAQYSYLIFESTNSERRVLRTMYNILREIRKTIIIYISNRFVDLIIDFILDVMN